MNAFSVSSLFKGLFCFLQPEIKNIYMIGIFSIFASRLQKGELSSAGSEHLPYKQRVTGSNPVAPTKTE
jgi:hypothetical protein